ncbi:AMP-binding enzyme [Aneurinibacillus soli]|uniref:Putative acyl--CoA ligase YhfT n=2 Tax=Aneurinibacillus soli TaxID=1500254 RepID=A0A0U5C5F8_9BACL|nr:AMP-binding protein [Aneurinibacillus soli]PYE62529.1 AMP-binding enzyme [Aneurinibacillus soli]BAU27091.1 putative acyl--CoA ligase YhfT [Aneurinibacillus soli]
MLKFFTLLYVLYNVQMLSPSGLYRLMAVLYQNGVNMMTLLAFSARSYADNIALVDEHETLSYKELWLQSEKLSIVLKENYKLNSGQKVGLLCKNHASLVKTIFAVSRLGADLYLLNAEMSKTQFTNLLMRHDFDFLVYDPEWYSFIEQSSYAKDKIVSYHDTLPAISNFLQFGMNRKQDLKRTTSGKLMLLTGGTTGHAKVAAHKACSLIQEHHVEVITVVPLMIYKMLRHNPEDLTSLRCIASGGTELNPKLVEEVTSKLGDVLYNLYGTSEAGLNIIATPQDLRYSAQTIGKKINGVRLKIVDKDKKEVEKGAIGQFYIQNKWSMINKSLSWIETGDMGYQDSNGYYFWCGRVDNLVISAGENVYPIEIERVLINHPQVEDVAVIGISDEIFGQRLKAFVLLERNASLTKEELFEWLRFKVARFQMPKDITFVDHIPYTPLGKLDKKQLR